MTTTTVPYSPQFHPPQQNPKVLTTPTEFATADGVVQNFIEHTNLQSAITQDAVYSVSGKVQWDLKKLNSVPFLMAEEFGLGDTYITHWSTDRIAHEELWYEMSQFKTALNVHSCAMRWPNSGITDIYFSKPADITELLGLEFNHNKKVGKGKKRMHVFGLTEGAFLHNRPSKDGYIHVSDTLSLKIAIEKDVPNDTNDGGGSIKKSFALRMLQESSAPHKDPKKLDALQIVIVGANEIYKGIFVAVEDNHPMWKEIDGDILVPEPSLVYELTASKYTFGKCVSYNRKPELGHTTFEPLQVAINYLNFTDYERLGEHSYNTIVAADIKRYNETVVDKNFNSIFDADNQLEIWMLNEEDINTYMPEDEDSSEEIRRFVNLCMKVSGGSPYVNSTMMDRSCGGTLKTVERLMRKNGGHLPEVFVSGARHYITYAPHAGEPNPPEGYLGFIYWPREEGQLHGDIRRVSINPNDCDDRVRDLLDGFDMDDSVQWSLLWDTDEEGNGIVYAWIARNPMSPDRGCLLRVQDKDIKILASKGYNPIKKMGQWQNPDLWKTEPTLHVGKLPNQPVWSWDDLKDYSTCYQLASVAGNLGQQALLVGVLQHSGVWDVNKHHILNSDVIDAQTNADGDLQYTVDQLAKFNNEAFLTAGNPVDEAIFRRAKKMLQSVFNDGIDKITLSPSPRQLHLKNCLSDGYLKVNRRQKIRRAMSNGNPAWLVMQLDPRVVEIVLNASLRIRGYWQQYFEQQTTLAQGLNPQDMHEVMSTELQARYLQRGYSTMDNGENDYAIAETFGHPLSPELYQTQLAGIRKEVITATHLIIKEAYRRASQMEYYQTGMFGAAWMQIHASRASRFSQNDQEDSPAPRPISVTPLVVLPEEELTTCFQEDYSRSTWIAPVAQANDGLKFDQVYKVKVDMTGIPYAVNEENGEIVANLGTLSKALHGEYVKFLGYVPRHHEWKTEEQNWDTPQLCAVFEVDNLLWTHS